MEIPSSRSIVLGRILVHAYPMMKDALASTERSTTEHLRCQNNDDHGRQFGKQLTNILYIQPQENMETSKQ